MWCGVWIDPIIYVDRRCILLINKIVYISGAEIQSSNSGGGSTSNNFIEKKKRYSNRRKKYNKKANSGKVVGVLNNYLKK